MWIVVSYAKGNYAPKVLFTISVKKSGNTFFSPQFFAVFVVVVVIVCLFVVFVLFLFRSFCLYGWLLLFFALLLLLFYMHIFILFLLLL